MNEKNYNIEASIKREADKETAKLLDPEYKARSEKLEELRGRYQTIMAEFEKLQDENADEEATNPLLDQANAIIAQMNELDPQIRGTNTLSLEESEFEMERRRLKLDHPKDIN
jgi:hypothetical protein